MKSKLWSFLAVVVFSTPFIGCASTNETAAAPGPAIFQMRMVTDVAAGDCDCDDMVVVQKGGETNHAETLHVLHAIVLDQKDLKSAKVGTDNLGRPEIAITFNANGAKRFAEVTRNSVGKRLAIVIDGKLYSAPTIRSEISGGKAVISGNFTKEEAKDLVARMNGALKK
jgi:preprotein translocase subunit SecD